MKLAEINSESVKRLLMPGECVRMVGVPIEEMEKRLQIRKLGEFAVWSSSRVARQPYMRNLGYYATIGQICGDGEAVSLPEARRAVKDVLVRQSLLNRRVN